MAGADAAPGTLSESPIRCGVMDRWQYLIVLAACLAITLPLEIFGDGVYRQPWRVVRAVLPVAAVFLVWDEVAIGATAPGPGGTRIGFGEVAGRILPAAI